MEVLVRRPVEKGKPVALVADGVRVHEVHDDPEAHAVRRVDERLQLFGRAETGTGREEA